LGVVVIPGPPQGEHELGRRSSDAGCFDEQRLEPIVCISRLCNNQEICAIGIKLLARRNEFDPSSDVRRFLPRGCKQSVARDSVALDASQAHAFSSDPYRGGRIKTPEPDSPRTVH
jgi:hypothetical protein